MLGLQQNLTIIYAQYKKPAYFIDFVRSTTYKIDSLKLKAFILSPCYGPAGKSGRNWFIMMRDKTLTKREYEILDLVLKEYRNQEIADTLQISVRTVEYMRRMIMRKTGARTPVGLLIWAINEGVVSIDKSRKIAF